MQTRLSSLTIPQPELWRLALTITGRKFGVALFPPVAREEIFWEEYEFDSSAQSILKALEDIVYDHPVLLSDFRRVDCVFDLEDKVLIPMEVDENSAETMAEAVLPYDSTREIMLFPMGSRARCAMSVDEQVLSFLKRTFYNINFHSCYGILARHFERILPSEESKDVILMFGDGKLTFWGFDSGALMLANDYDYESPTDAAYYIFASMAQLGFMDENGKTYAKVMVYGENAMQGDSVTEFIKRYLPDVSALPFPTIRFRAGRNTLNIPYPVLLSCE